MMRCIPIRACRGPYGAFLWNSWLVQNGRRYVVMPSKQTVPTAVCQAAHYPILHPTMARPIVGSEDQVRAGS